MRDLDALLNSLVNIDRNSLVASLSSESEAAQRFRLVSAPLRSAPSDTRRFRVRLGSIGFWRSSSKATRRRRCQSAMSLCKSLEERLRDRGHS